MQSEVVLKIEKLQAALKEIKLETTQAQEETKEAHPLQNKIDQLR